MFKMFRMIPSCLTVLLASLVTSNTTDEEWNLCQLGPCDCYDMGAVLTKTVYCEAVSIEEITVQQYIPRDTESIWFIMNGMETISSNFFIKKGIADSLRELYFEMNPLTKLNRMMFAGLTNLEKLCIHSSITEIPRDVLSELPRLAHLEIKHNDYLTTIPTGFLHGQHNLQEVQLSANGHVTSLPGGLLCATPSIVNFFMTASNLSSDGLPRDVFCSEQSLIKIDLSFGKLTYIKNMWFSRLYNLQYLGLGSNSIENIDVGAFRNLISLRTLRLDGNRLEFIRPEMFSTMGSLKQLHLQFNNVVELDSSTFKGLQTLEDLRLHDNNIAIIERAAFVGLYSLHYLYLQRNRLTVLADSIFWDLRHLSYLDLAKNQIPTIPSMLFAGLHSIRGINLSGNILTHINTIDFSYLLQLEHLDLSDNNIAHLEDHVFEHLPSLSVVNLSSNELLITGLPHILLTPGSLKAPLMINLKHNRLRSSVPELCQSHYVKCDLGSPSNRNKIVRIDEI